MRERERVRQRDTGRYRETDAVTEEEGQRGTKKDRLGQRDIQREIR